MNHRKHCWSCWNQDMEKEQEYEMSLFGKGKYVVSCENSQHPYQDIKQTGAAQGKTRK